MKTEDNPETILKMNRNKWGYIVITTFSTLHYYLNSIYFAYFVH